MAEEQAVEIKRMSRAFVYIDCHSGKERDLMNKLLQHHEVKEVHLITGKNDIIAVLEVKRDILVPSSTNIYHFIEKVRGYPEVNDTETVIPLYSMTKWTQSA